jgi:adenosylcobinamide kinase / adenosylcobinamide-phosphate guanylyltransferase
VLELYLGGARSGKSRLAEQRVLASGLARVYVATATAEDDEMAARIMHHQQSRGSAEWLTLEAPSNLAAVLRREADDSRCILVDCLTLWLSNCLLNEAGVPWEQEREALLNALPDLPGTIILVSNEVGQGIVPMGALSRRFVDESGRLHQAIAQLADRVVFVTAGLEQTLKGGV